MQMPVMDGLAATRLIRQSERGGTVPILAMTANAFGEDHRRCLAAGMNDHIAKPVDPSNLYATLIKWLSLSGHRAPATPTPMAAAAVPPTARADEADPAFLLALQRIPGLDVDLGLRAVRGRVASFRRLLGTFIAQHGHDDEAIASALGEQRPADATHLAHALKGAAGTLGLSEIHAAAAELNDELRNPGSHQEPAVLLATLSGAMRHTLPPLESLLDTTPGNPS
ncbi:MAG TPA: response regulator, partial [Azonexus sp.]|nr:response regulator [Azonexus sp.]